MGKKNEISLFNEAKRALKYIERTAKKDPHVAVEGLVVLITSTLLITYSIGGVNQDPMVSLIYLAVSGIIAAILAGGYTRLAEAASNIIQQDKIGHSATISVLFVALSCAFGGLMFKQEDLIKVAFGLIVLSLVVLPTIGYLKLAKSTALKRHEIVYKIIRYSHWIVGIVTGIIDIIIFFSA